MVNDWGGQKKFLETYYHRLINNDRELEKVTYVATEHDSPSFKLFIAHLGQVAELLSLLGTTSLSIAVENVLVACVHVDQHLFMRN